MTTSNPPSRWQRLIRGSGPGFDTTSAPRPSIVTLSASIWRNNRIDAFAYMVTCADVYAARYATRHASRHTCSPGDALGRTYAATAVQWVGRANCPNLGTTNGAVSGDTSGTAPGASINSLARKRQCRVPGWRYARHDYWTPTEADRRVLGMTKRETPDSVRGITCCLTDCETFGGLAGAQHAVSNSRLCVPTVDRSCTALKNAPLGWWYTAVRALQLGCTCALKQCGMGSLSQRAAGG